MANTSARMLRLLSLLQTHRYWPGAELSERLQVSPRTLRRDVDRLRELGYPVDAARGVAGGYQLRAGAAVPPLLLDDEEAVAIAVGLRAAASAATGLEETSVRALAKITQLLPPRLRRRIDALQATTSAGSPALDASPLDATVLTTIAVACRGEERLRFGYTTHDGRSATRLVEPHRLVSWVRCWYLVAWDLDRADWRTFRVDRITEPASTGARFRPRELPGGDPVAWIRERLADRPHRHAVKVLVHAPAAAVHAAVGRWATIEEVSPDSCRLLMQADDLRWPIMALGVVGADFTVESPPELHERVRDFGALLTRAAAASPTDRPLPDRPLPDRPLPDRPLPDRPLSPVALDPARTQAAGGR